MRKLLLLVALCVGPALGASPFIQVKNCAGSGNSISCTFDSTPGVGHLITVGAAPGNGAITVTDSIGGNTYVTRFDSNYNVHQWSTRVVNTGSPFTVTYNQTGLSSITIAEYDTGTVSTVDGVCSAISIGQTSGNYPCGSPTGLTTTNANDIIVCTGRTNGGTALHTPVTAGFTIRGTTVATQMSIMDSAVTATVSNLNPTWQSSGTNLSECACVAYTMAAPASSSVPHRVVTAQ